MFRKMGGRGWAWNIVLSASLFAVPFFLVWSLVNSVAWYHHSTQVSIHKHTHTVSVATMYSSNTCVLKIYFPVSTIQQILLKIFCGKL